MAKIRSLHSKGASVLHIASALNVSRNVVRDRLVELGLPVRTRREASLLRMAKLTAAERQALAKAAHDAVRGSKHDDNRLAARALSVQAAGKQSKAEGEVMQRLVGAGLKVVPLLAVGKYNLDLACIEARVGIEVHNTWHGTMRKALQDARKLSYMIQNGWAISYVHEKTLTEADVAGIVAMCKARIKHHHQ